jgi:hypothetical protein
MLSEVFHNLEPAFSVDNLSLSTKNRCVAVNNCKYPLIKWLIAINLVDFYVDRQKNPHCKSEDFLKFKRNDYL